MDQPVLRDRDLDVLRRTFERFPCVHEVRLFGSRATGHARRESDIDLLISAPAASASQWQAIIEALEEAPLIYDLDIVRADDACNPRLMEKISRQGLAIYP